jgi:hypothetical protein
LSNPLRKKGAMKVTVLLVVRIVNAYSWFGGKLSHLKGDGG